MKEVLIFTVLVSVTFGIPVLLFKIILKFCPAKPETAHPAPVVVEREVKENVPEVDTKKAVLARLLEMQASAGGEMGKVRHITTLEGHRIALRDALEQAVRRVVIISPFLSAGAVKADSVTGLVRYAVSRGVEVLIFVDRTLNMTTDGSENQSSCEGREILENAGAIVFVVDRIHNKTLCIDDKIIIEGSFNWLSAVRSKNHDHQRQENSMMVIGGDAGRMIVKETKAMAQLAMKVAA